MALLANSFNMINSPFSHENVARLFDDRCQGVHVQQGSISIGQGRGWVEDGREKHEHRGEKTNELSHIAQVDTQRRQRPTQAHYEETKGQKD